jgi:hypothetical protein
MHFSPSCHHISFRSKYSPLHRILTSWDSSFSTVIRLHGGYLRNQCSTPSRDNRFFSFPRRLQTNSGAHPAAYSLAPEALFFGGGDSQSMKLTIHLHLVSSKESVALYLHCPMHLHALCLIKHRASFAYLLLFCFNYTVSNAEISCSTEVKCWWLWLVSWIIKGRKWSHPSLMNCPAFFVETEWSCERTLLG